MQAVLGEGPVLDALTTRDGPPSTRIADLDADDATDAVPRWRRWAPRVRAAGFAGVLSYPLTGRGFAGALTVYARVALALGPDACLIGGLFADQAAAALHGARRETEMSRALARRELLGRAKGIIAERFGLTDPETFALLAESARRAGCGLGEMATQVVDGPDTRAAGRYGSPVVSATPRPA